MAKEYKDLVVGLDIGTSKIMVVVAEVQPGGVLDSQAHEPGSREHLSVLSGSLEVTAQGLTSKLKAGETARYAVDGPHTIRNSAKSAATALLVVLHP